MPIRLMHVLDSDAHEDDARMLSVLLRSLPAARVQQHVVAAGPAVAGFEVPSRVGLTRIGRRIDWPLACGVDLRRVLGGHRPDVVHAWGSSAAAASATVRPGALPTVATLCEPGDAHRFSRWWRTLRQVRDPSTPDETIHVLCSSGMVQRRLVEAGVPVEATGVIRPAVDFAAIRSAKERMSRASMGLPPDALVLLAASPPSRDGGHYDAIWASAILRKVRPRVHLVIPGVSREQRRLRRFARSVYCPEIYHLTGDRYTPAELLAVADALVVAATGDVATGWLAWAMAAGVTIIGSAVPAVAELIADGHNGFLCRAGEPATLAGRIRDVFDNDERRRQCTESARAQAYDVFRTQRCVDEHLKVIENLAARRPALAGVVDAAVDV